ncbi:hypothetical protein GQ53DRAFT_466138 [Thozetella sp. PMI_491]|nr:hypothetical protein GQ53DRAFT_466138 [Thozetella sp. PMI_491]
MLSPQDSNVIIVDDILEAHILSENFEVLPCARMPSDPPSANQMFCCLARWDNDKTIVYMPLARKFLPLSDRRKLDGFAPNSVTSVVDLTPNVLGTLGGFVDQGCQAFAGLGYSEERHQTWRVLHPRCKVFDGPPQDILDDFDTGKLRLPDLPTPGYPKVAIVAGENNGFRLRPHNEKMPSIDQFLAPIETLDSVIKSSIKPDFTALVMPATILHESTISRLSKSIQAMVKLGLVVHTTLHYLPDYGIPQDRSVLVIIASPFPGLAEAKVAPSGQWATNSGASSSAVIVRDLIEDLAFNNPRATHDPCEGFVCPVPLDQDGGRGGNTKYIYNHHTGHTATADLGAIDMDAETVWLSRSWTELVHPVRQDLLTVRELARLQGFEDDHLFYGSQQAQVQDVLAAHPPAIARAIATAIQSVVKASTKKELGDTGVSTQTAKRARVETAFEDAGLSIRT